MISEKSIIKVFTENDLGRTKSHQAGFTIPKSVMNMEIFPILPDNELNPRVRIILKDIDSNLSYAVSFIKYNNKVFGGTRYEYRLTGIARFLKMNLLKPNDSIEFFKPVNSIMHFKIIKNYSKNSSSKISLWSVVEGVENVK